MTEVVVVTGIGGVRIACHRDRLGPGRSLVIADFDAEHARARAAPLAATGITMTTVQVDVSDRGVGGAARRRTGALGTLRTLVHTAGLSPTMAATRTVLDVEHAGHRLRPRRFADSSPTAPSWSHREHGGLHGRAGARVEVEARETDALLAEPSAARRVDSGYAD